MENKLEEGTNAMEKDDVVERLEEGYNAWEENEGRERSKGEERPEEGYYMAGSGKEGGRRGKSNERLEEGLIKAYRSANTVLKDGFAGEGKLKGENSSKEGKVVKAGKEGSQWKPPDPGFIKINFDGAYRKPGCRGTFGVVARDEEGKWMSGRSGDCFISNALSAEMFGAKASMELAMDKGWEKVTFETDSKELFESIQDDTRVPWYVEAQARALTNLLNSFPSWSFSCVRRDSNLAADWVAKAARDGALKEDWVDNIPLGLIGILDKDGLPGPPRDFVSE